MISEEIETDLPVDYSVWKCPVCGTVRQTEAEMIQHLGRKDQHHERPVEIELVKKSDAEEARENARRSERQKILDKIKDKREEFNNGRSNEYPQTVLTELLKEVEQS